MSMALAICRLIVDADGGRGRAEEHEPQGAPSISIGPVEANAMS
jgi:K+-sensing histidine kinase KdpD